MKKKENRYILCGILVNIYLKYKKGIFIMKYITHKRSNTDFKKNILLHIVFACLTQCFKTFLY